MRNDKDFFLELAGLCLALFFIWLLVFSACRIADEELTAVPPPVNTSGLCTYTPKQTPAEAIKTVTAHFEALQETHAERTQTLTVTATAYCPCELCCGKSDGITATGAVATAGHTIAVDPDYIPLGTTVLINGVEYVAEDTGGAIGGNKIDIFFNSHEEALAFGVQELDIIVKT